MELLEIEGLFLMDSGAPSPTIVSNDNELLITFYVDKESLFVEPQQRDTFYDTGVVTLRFKLALKYTFGLPNDETMHGHPYSRLGMRPYSFYELKDSDLIASMQKINSVHPYHNPETWKECRHYIITFHDNMFECVASGFEIREENVSLHDQAATMLNELFRKRF